MEKVNKSTLFLTMDDSQGLQVIDVTGEPEVLLSMCGGTMGTILGNHPDLIRPTKKAFRNMIRSAKKEGPKSAESHSEFLDRILFYVCGFFMMTGVVFFVLLLINTIMKLLGI